MLDGNLRAQTLDLRCQEGGELAHPFFASAHKAVPGRIVPVCDDRYFAAELLPVALAARRAVAHLRPEGHVIEDALKVKILVHLPDLFLQKRAVVRVVRAAQAVAGAVRAGAVPVGIAHAPVRMTVIFGVVENDAVIKDRRQLRGMAEIEHAPDPVLMAEKAAVHYAAFGRPVAKAGVGLHIDHNGVDLRLFYLLYIVVRVKFRQEGRVPVLYVHIQQRPVVRRLIPFFLHSSSRVSSVSAPGHGSCLFLCIIIC